MKALLSWLARTALLYVLLALAIGLALTLPADLAGYLARETASFEEVRAEIAEERAAAQERLERRAGEVAALPLAALEERIAALAARRERIGREIDRLEGGFLSAYRPSRVLARKRAELELALVESELELLRAAREPRRELDRASAWLERNPTMPTKDAIAAARSRCTRDRQGLAAFDRRWRIDREAREMLLSERSELVAAVRASCRLAETLARRRERALAAGVEAGRARGALEALRPRDLPDVAQGIPRTLLRDILLKALYALLALLLVPPAIRVLLYHVLAPLAAKWPPMRFGGERGGNADAPAFPPAGESRVSLAITLGEGEEALVRQDYLQSSSLSSAKRTHWLLDWSHPVASFASGMRFLTAVRGTGEDVLVSPVKDPLAELAVLEIPRGGAAVVRPSALAGLVRRTGEPVRITTRWRLFSLPAWLTLQLRYFVFHGPVRLVLKGGRGVRIEPAQRGRIVGQGQLIGFSTDCAYSVIRTETFWPYFLGREPLLKDRIEQGRGVLLVEEAPLAGRSGLRRGFEGAFDAVLKLFGV
ncbi:hypothetical protein [Erythrobacter sp. HL-111]|uniref:hypothetical protein n=1 Tax=Erythrobacter sp. HL-111 TaxID=1798193 RepID=UPI0006D9A7CC|nr:hypothetical protein [Erythrobacter sp. HL-111]KPP94831.1 MAG: hypothetical protein HLUCCO15_03565 [Erythrobacteraceae bacterium HL-111]SDS87248.1 hypothetical protein SAMN04515621_2408 [Erythrobacter sp. HL-111]